MFRLWFQKNNCLNSFKKSQTATTDCWLNNCYSSIKGNSNDVFDKRTFSSYESYC